MFIATSVITTSDRYDRQPSVCRRNIGADRVTAASSPSGYLALMQRRQDPVQAPRLRRESPSLEPVALREQRVGDRSHFDEGRGACERETGVTERRARLLLENRRDSLGGAAAIVCLQLRRAKVVALRTKASLAAGDGPCIFLSGSDDPQ